MLMLRLIPYTYTIGTDNCADSLSRLVGKFNNVAI